MSLETDEGGDARSRGCVLERKPRKEFPRDKRRRGGSGKAPSGHSGKNDYTKLEKLCYARGRERERKKKERKRQRQEEKEGECSGDEAAVSRNVTVARSFIVELFLREKPFLQANRV